jgi:tetratricopeptide (TPR) repeat protein
MNKGKAATIAASIGLVFFLLTWLISHPGSAGQEGAKQPDAIASASQPLPRDPADQKKFFESYLEKHPGYVPALLKLSQLERSFRQLPEARKHLEEALAQEEKLIDARLQLAEVCDEMDDFAEAQRQYEELLKLDPHQVGALTNLGSLLARQGRNDDARRYWQEALLYGPNTESGRAAADGLAKLDGRATSK